MARASCPAGQRSSLTAPDESVTGRFSAAATSFTQQPVAQLPWGHVTVLLDKLDGQRERDWYAAAAVEYGWSRNVLLNQIMSQLQPRAGTAPSNFTAQLPAADSELAQQLTRDPYVLDFLDLTGPVAERDLEKALVDRLHDFLLELGHSFAFVGRQYRFDVDGDEFAIDLPFFNWAQSRFVVVELEDRPVPTGVRRPARLLRQLGVDGPTSAKTTPVASRAGTQLCPRAVTTSVCR